MLGSGLSKDAIHRLVRGGSLILELPSVYRVRGAPRTWLQIVAAVSVWAGDSSAITGAAAAAVYGLDPFGQRGPIDVLTTRYRRSPRADVRLHRTKGLAVEDTRLLQGIRVVDPPRLILDLARWVDPDRLEKTLEDLMRRRLTSSAELEDRLARIPTGTTGLSLCKAVLSRRTADAAVAGSDLEIECLQDLRRGGAPPPVRQHWISNEKERIGRIDLAYPQATLGIEVDSFQFHGSFRSFHADRERYNAAVAAGWRLLLYTKRTNRPRFVQQVLHILSEGQPSLFTVDDD